MDSNVEKVPDVGALALPTPADLDGYDIADVLAALKVVGESFASHRMAVGLLLWKLRRPSPDGVYGDHVAAQAERFDVDPRTLRRWRVAAEQEYRLPVPDVRTAVARARPAPDTVSRVPEVVKPDEVIPPPIRERTSKPPRRAVQQSLPGAEDWGLVLPDRAPSREEAAAAKRLARRLLDWAAQEPAVPKQPPKSGRAPSRDVQPIAKSKHRA